MADLEGKLRELADTEETKCGVPLGLSENLAVYCNRPSGHEGRHTSVIITVKDAERIIHKIEACEGMAAKLVLLRNVLALGRSEGLEEAAKRCDEESKKWIEPRAKCAVESCSRAIRALKNSKGDKG